MTWAAEYRIAIAHGLTASHIPTPPTHRSVPIASIYNCVGRYLFKYIHCWLGVHQYTTHIMWHIRQTRARAHRRGEATRVHIIMSPFVTQMMCRLHRLRVWSPDGRPITQGGPSAACIIDFSTTMSHTGRSRATPTKRVYYMEYIYACTRALVLYFACHIIAAHRPH